MTRLRSRARTSTLIATATLLAAFAGACGPSQPPPENPSPSAGGAPGGEAAENKIAAAEKFIAAKQWTSAKAVLNDELSSNPNNAKAVFYVGVCDENLGDVEAAKASYKKALGLDPKLVDAALNLSAMLLDAKDPASALPVIKQGLEGDPQNPLLLTNRALALDDLGKADEAAKAYQAALAAKPDDKLRSAYIDLLLRSKKKDEALKQLKTLVANSQDPLVLAAASAQYVKVASYQECVSALDKAIKIKSNSELYVRRGLCKHALQDDAAAGKDFEKAVQVDGKSAAAHYYYGRSLVATDRTKALEELNKAADLDSSGGFGKRAHKEIEALKSGPKTKGKKRKK